MIIQNKNALAGKTALVTGASRGIGLEIARGYAAAGAQVVIHCRNKQHGAAIARELGGRYVTADFNDEDAIPALVRQITTATNTRLDILVNNAGFEIPMTIDEMDMDAFDRTWRINFRAPVELIYRLLPYMTKPGASIINITSIHDVVPYAGNSAYCAAKAALAMVTRSLAIELAPRGIRVNNLAPGAVETERNRTVIERIGRERFRDWIPMGRAASPTEMVGPALFLASESASYVTGETIYVDGAYRHHLVRYRHHL